jgi:D-alanine--poly(phosphoribitol) ligase subunit 2
LTVSLAAKILDVLVEVTEVDEVRQGLELKLYDLQILDSLRTVELIVAFSETFGIEISPAELTAGQWATPGRIVADLERRLRA